MFLRFRQLAQAAFVCILVASVALSAEGERATDISAEKLDFFEKRIRPLLVKHCYDCHGPDLDEGNLRLDIKTGWQRGGGRGPAIVPGDPSASLLIRVVSHTGDRLRMPPPDAGEKLSDGEIDDLIYWIRQGAPDPRIGETIVTDVERSAREHWAFQPIAAPDIDIEADLNPIDFLIERKLHGQGYLATDLADMPTLIRRTTFDLIGLPPTAEQLATPREDFPQLVKELLASPHYGERWGRHWLDVARYSDAKDGVLMYGDDRVRPFAYTYRDYVIRAFNDDKPFDQFVREQLAADQLDLPADSPDLAAMGLLTLGRMFDSNQHDVIDDQIDVIGRGLLGLSLACARCHDHKFDPVPTADYYSLYGVFASSVRPVQLPRIGSVSEEGRAFEEEYTAKLQEISESQQAHYEQTLRVARERTADYLVQVATAEPDVSETTIFFLSLTPEQLRPQITKRWRQLIARRAFPEDPVFGPWHDLMREPILRPNDLRPNEWRTRGVDPRIIDGLVAAQPSSMTDIAEVYGRIIRDAWLAGAGEEDLLAGLLVSRQGPVWFPERDVQFYLSRQPGDAFRGLLGQLDAIAVKHKEAAPRAMVMHDSEVLHDPVIFQRGDPSARGNPVPRRFVGILSPEDRAEFTHRSGRLELASAIASPDNPLTARVWVNRVWMHHFGESLVENPGDFGLQAAPPLHLDLLDFLADYFIKSGWRTKPLHELILSSRAYQRSSLVPETEPMAMQLQSDPDNSLLWRGNRRRLDLEQMRDTLLSVTDELDTTMFGRPIEITDTANLRRTIYAFVERQNIPAMVQTFDFANADTSTSRRSQTTVPQQALFALNSEFMLARSKAMAQRVGQGGPSEQVSRLYAFVLGREPTRLELEQCEAFLASSSPEQLAQVLLMSNELMFVD